MFIFLSAFSFSFCARIRFQVIFPFKRFNKMQSELYPQVYDDLASLVVSSPTGSGKTCVLELALVKLFSTNPAAKVVYMAPTKALCNERCEDWKAKFMEKVGMDVKLVTGDSPASASDLKSCSIIV